ncbi:hypothetical protein BKA64DRAFT_372509 [Cadophora sp. MPI-SDFR-AT-0126]|nr:hypothetical protein BKA64DRAFT_372509 [Leotiomycetes sp. MPI-SDFR-AT-0126]
MVSKWLLASETCQGIGPPTLSSPRTFPFLALPAELRNRIYEYAVAWPTVPASRFPESLDQNFRDKGCENPSISVDISLVSKTYSGSLSTLSIFLVNRQISSEALSILYKTPLIINSPMLRQLHLDSKNMKKFFSDATLERLRFVTFDIELVYTSWQCANAKDCPTAIEYLIRIWDVTCALEKMVINVTYVEPSKKKGWTFGEAEFHEYAVAVLEMSAW